MQDFNLPEILGLGGTGFAATVAVLGLFWNADSAFSGEFRVALSNWLQRLEVAPRTAWPRAFANMFDRLFGVRHFTFNCFIRSSLASFIFILILLIISTNFLFLKGKSAHDIVSFLRVELINIVMIFLSFNIFADYISLFKSRKIINIMLRCSKYYHIVTLLVIDIIITIFVYFATAITIMFLLNFLFGVYEPSILYSIQSRVLPAVQIHTNPAFVWLVDPNIAMIFFVFFLSTFFTSVWVWLCAASWGVMRLAGRISPVLAFLKWALPIKTHPMRAVGEVAAAITMVGFLAVNMVALI